MPHAMRRSSDTWQGTPALARRAPRSRAASPRDRRCRRRRSAPRRAGARPGRSRTRAPPPSRRRWRPRRAERRARRARARRAARRSVRPARPTPRRRVSASARRACRAAPRPGRRPRAARAPTPSGTSQPWPSGPTRSIVVARGLLGEAQRAGAEDLVEDLDALADRAVHRERTAQDEVGAGARRAGARTGRAATRRAVLGACSAIRPTPSATRSLASDGHPLERRPSAARRSRELRHGSSAARRLAVEVLQRVDAEAPLLDRLDGLRRSPRPPRRVVMLVMPWRIAAERMW